MARDSNSACWLCSIRGRGLGGRGRGGRATCRKRFARRDHDHETDRWLLAIVAQFTVHAARDVGHVRADRVASSPAAIASETSNSSPLATGVAMACCSGPPRLTVHAASTRTVNVPDSTMSKPLVGSSAASEETAPGSMLDSQGDQVGWAGQGHALRQKQTEGDIVTPSS